MQLGPDWRRPPSTLAQECLDKGMAETLSLLHLGDAGALAFGGHIHGVAPIRAFTKKAVNEMTLALDWLRNKMM
jgi:hypothetical protein